MRSSPLGAGPVLAALLSTALISGVALALPAPPEAREASYRINPAARALIEPLVGEQLGKDAYFVRVLREVLERDDFSPADRADALTLMLRKIGWLFNGTAPIPPGFSYPRMFQSQAATYLAYQSALETSAVDGTPLLVLATRECASNALRCASAILLAAMADREATRRRLGSMLDARWIPDTQVPPITLHALCLAVVLARDPALAGRLAALLPSIRGEEEQEDVLSSVAMYEGPRATRVLQQFLAAAADERFDQSVETAAILLRRREPPLAFDAFYAELIARAADESVRSALSALRARSFADGYSSEGRGTWQKLWDDFSIVVWDDGTGVAFGSTFRDFVPKLPAPDRKTGEA